MLRLFVRSGYKQAKYSCAQLSKLYSTKTPEKDEQIKNWYVEDLHPLLRVKKCFRRDYADIKEKLFFWKDFKSSVYDENGEVRNWENPHAPIFPNYCDIVIIGGGVIGSAVAYWCKMLSRGSFRVVVIERDPTYKTASTVLSVGGLRQQFSLEENIEMSMFGAEFIRNVNRFLRVHGKPLIDLQFQPFGYLSLATKETAHILEANSKLQQEKGANNVLLSAEQLNSRFPWLKTDDIELGCLGLEKEGWFDPWSLLCAFKERAKSLGVEYIKAEAKGFYMKDCPDIIMSGVPPFEYEKIEYLTVQTSDGELRPIHFSKCVVAAGAFSGEIAKMAKIGYGENLLSVPLPVEPRKRYVYCFHAPEGPGLNTPMTIDPTGAYFRREGLANHYICGLSPTEAEEPPVDNLDVDLEFFDNRIWPILANRVKGFDNLKVKSSWAGYYEYNKFDENGIIGFHPYHDNLMFATGFSGHGIQQAPAVGLAVAELIVHDEFRTIDLTRLSFDRFMTLEPMREVNIW